MSFDNFDRGFDKEMKKFKKTAVGFGVLAVLINLVFWLGLIAGGLLLLKHFGII